MHVGTTVRLLTSDALPKSLSSQPVDRILVCSGNATCQTKFPNLMPPSGSTLAYTGNVPIQQSLQNATPLA